MRIECMIPFLYINTITNWIFSYKYFFLVASRECSRLIVGFHQKARTGKLTAVYRKYRTTKFDVTTNLEPANFLLDNKP